MNVQQAVEWKTKSKLFVSLAAKPGKTGENFYNTLFKHHNIDAEYIACECIDLKSDMQLVREHCAGASITMPYKKQVEKYLDMSSTNFMPVNTVVNKDKFLTGYNCDYLGLQDLLKDSVKNKRVVILGDGAMADNVSLLCADAKNVKIFSRRKDTWIYRHNECDVLINATSIGMGTDETPVDKIKANLVVDCVIGNTKLTQNARLAGISVVTGAEIYIAQFQHQFKLYTGQDPDQDVLKLITKKVFNV